MFFSAVLILVCWGSLGSVSGSPAVEAVYGDVVSVVSPGQQHLTRESLRSLFNILGQRVQCGEVSCEKCNLTDAVDQLINDHSNHSVNETGGGGGENVTVSVSQFSALAAGCVLYLSSPELVCNATRNQKWGEETEHFLHKITHGDHEHHEDHEGHRDHVEGELHQHGEHSHMDIGALKLLFQELREHYEALSYENCVAASVIMTEVNASSPDRRQEVGAVLGRVLFHALQGRCFIIRRLPDETFFLDFIMRRLGSENFTVRDLETLMRSVNIGPDLHHDHGHGDEHGHGHGDEHGHGEHGEHEDEHGEEQDHGDENGQADEDPSSLRWRKRSSHEENAISFDQTCFTAEELALIYGLADKISSTSVLGRPGLARLSPALLQQILSGACAETIVPPSPDGLSQTERYIYATIANTIITLVAMLGVAVLLCTSCTSVFQLCVQFCISLAVGSLTGDALLHLIPIFLGLHQHSHEAHAHEGHEEGTPDHIYKMLVVLAGIYFFYLMETIFSLITREDSHRHSHRENAEPHHCNHGRVIELFQQERNQQGVSNSSSKTDLVNSEDSENPTKETPGPIVRTREQRMLPFMIIIGDGIHNFADGLAIGAAFALSWRSGLATSIAVFCHELPHELGDFAILLSCGLSVRKALLFNLGSAMTSFIGLYIALSVATDQTAIQWIAAITTGLFLYVGLADMLPTMIHVTHKKPWLMFALQNIGLLIGWGILLLLSLFEEKISF